MYGFLIYGFFVTLAALTLSPKTHGASPAPVRVLQRLDAPRRAPSAGSDQLYSLRARRRFAAYLRLRLLEMREAGLDRAAAVVEGKLPVDALVPKR